MASALDRQSLNATSKTYKVSQATAKQQRSLLKTWKPKHPSLNFLACLHAVLQSGNSSICSSLLTLGIRILQAQRYGASGKTAKAADTGRTCKRQADGSCKATTCSMYWQTSEILGIKPAIEAYLQHFTPLRLDPDYFVSITAGNL